MAKYFIDRPIFAWVIAIIIMLAGVMSVITLPVQQYPTIAPPSVRISAVYPGASAQTLEDSVTQVIEQNMTGLDNLLYMSSQSSSAGSATVTLTFAAGTDPDIAQVQVQNKLALAEALLPQEVQQQGVSVTKASTSFLMVVGLVSENAGMSRADLADFAYSQLKDPLSRTSGVGEIRVFGSQYAMRLWLQPEKLNAYGLTPLEVKAAVGEQNTQFAAGQLGGLPSVQNQQLNATIIAQTRLEAVDQFENILLKVNTDGSQVRLKDVARVELGAEDYSVSSFYNGNPAAGIAIQLASGANALDTAKAVRERISELSAFFPEGVKAVYPYDTTPFVQISIEEVVQTLIEAVVLVFLVMYLFLGNFRATLIPTIAVPVVLLGTFGVMAAFGYSINTLTMFGMVLAIGLLVDDAIVVVENVERVMDEDGLPPKEATRKSMGQITAALVGIALVLSAVFVPMAFMSGSTGAIYRQFSLTIVSAMLLSVMVALILTPALCATLLKPAHKGELEHQKGFFGWFNRTFAKATDKYMGGVSATLSRPVRLVVIYIIMLLIMAFLYVRLPTSFLPEEDQGVLINLVQLPQGATLERTNKVMKKLENHFLSEESVESIFTVAGFSFAGQGQNMGLAFVKLKDWDERKDPSQSANAIIGRAWGAVSQFKDATVYPINLPPIPELGVASGFDVMLQDRNNLGHDKLVGIRNQLLGMAAQDSRLAGVRPNGMQDVPIFRIDIDYEKVKSLGLNISDVNSTLSTAWGGSYVNDFLDRGRVKRVYLQADAPYRMLPEDLEQWYVRNRDGEMVPFSAFITTRWDFGSPRLERYNGVPALNIQGQAAPGLSTGDAMQAIEEIVAKLPPGVGIEWTGMSYQERVAGSQAPLLYAISLLVVFLCLAALYESWSVPFSVILVVPLGILGALIAANSRELANDVYFQVGLLTTIGLSAKNAILIVEFAKSLVDQGKGIVEATLEAARMRLRPILMTSMAFILGVLPLAISTGAGAMSRQAIGTGVIGGMLAATFLAIFFVPLFYVLVMKLTHKLRGQNAQ
ncbi:MULTISPECIES: efflux RND transporter permease subunit [unclassified Thalassolituus]|jgi:hydrophobe/amphiphile efflux-1 (HAE1) family protein|uniref:efflux RND transporter permease subunit n=1 Tax=Oceanospirillaceae TaxID=135620 RepID=UPI0011955FFB|nr:MULTISPECIES: efflux RND transporter permease subunit [unclassified Thalassolituus]MCA6058441.1 efflux RND transporter permease subunit [Thalassolituus sp. ST750PaO-4]TVV42116.1 efflux RND transporter permease subunit [Thalassolituus sp. C2-1]